MNSDNLNNMENENKEICVCCGKSIEEGQAVYCPDCGAPMHRDCWQEKGGCPLKDKHGGGFTWQPAENASQNTANSSAPYGQTDYYNQYGGNQPQNPYVQNRNGQSQNPYGQNGSGQSQNPYGQNPYGQNEDNRDGDFDSDNPFKGLFDAYGAGDGFPRKSDEEIEKEYSEKKYMGVSQREMMCFMNVNSPSALYRVALFKYMAEHGKKMSLNFFAGCLAPYNQFYKGMIPLGLLIMAVNFVTSLPQLIFMYLSYFNPDKLESFVTSAIANTSTTLAFIQWGLMILLCFFGDYLYLLYMTKKIKKVRAKFTDEGSEEYLTALAEAGRPRVSKIVICIGIYAVLCLLAMVVMAALGL